MDEWDEPIEETGEFDQPERRETHPRPIAGWKDELNLAEFPIAALTRSHSRRSNDAGVRGSAGAARQSADRPPADDHGDAQARPADLARRRGSGRPDPVDQATEQFHRPPGSVLALRVDRAPGLAAERTKLPADRGSAAPLGGRGADVRERLVGQRGQELGRRAISRARQRDALRPGAVADLGAIGEDRARANETGPKSRQDPPCPCRVFAGTR